MEEKLWVCFLNPIGPVSVIILHRCISILGEGEVGCNTAVKTQWLYNLALNLISGGSLGSLFGTFTIHAYLQHWHWCQAAENLNLWDGSNSGREKSTIKQSRWKRGGVLLGPHGFLMLPPNPGLCIHHPTGKITSRISREVTSGNS